MREAGLEESEIGVKIAGKKYINNLRYAILLAETENGLKRLIITIQKEGEKMGTSKCQQLDPE